MEVALHAQHFFVTSQRCCCLRIPPFSLPSLLTVKNPNFRPKSKLGFIKGLSFRCRTMAYSTIPVQVKENIDVNEKEEQIFEQLLQVVRHFKLKTQLRVAGGWVRDKLLGKECHDIDIALDDMLGREFCEKVNEYFSHTGEENKSVHVIQSNPNQSKHLETANMRLLDVPIDFVNLRSETYSENSRIPTMEFGTAEQDAYRRDLTINSLFYNINTKSVEDFTRRGISDLKSGKIVTPLPPKETFLDDPLRVLRAIRFGARFGFVLDEELKEAAASEEVKAAIADKISRERIGHEIDLMVSGNQPVQAMTYICDLQLFWVVFSLPPESELSLSEGCDRLCISYMEAAWDLLQLIGCEVFDDKQKRLYLYGALFLPLRQFVYKGNKGKKIPLVNHIFGKSLKLKANDSEMVISLHSAIEGSEESKGFMSLIPVISSNVDADSGRGSLDVPVSSKQRVLAGLLLKDIKGLWRVSLLLCTLLYPVSFDHTVASLDRRIALEKSRDLFMKVENIIIELGLDNVWEMKPLVSGKELMSILQLKTGGPQVKEWQDELTKWQLEYPSGTAEEFLDWMRETLSKREKEWQGELTKWQLAHPSGTVEEFLDWMRETHSKRAKEWQGELTKWQLAYPSGTAEEFLNWMRETHSKRAKLE